MATLTKARDWGIKSEKERNIYVCFVLGFLAEAGGYIYADFLLQKKLNEGKGWKGWREAFL